MYSFLMEPVLKKNNQVWARLTDDRVARDDRGRHIECGVYLTNHSREVRLKALSSEKMMINKFIDHSHVIREQVRKISFGLETIFD